MMNLRRNRTLPEDMGITLDPRNTLFIHTDTSRLVRPLLVVEPVVTEDGRITYEPLIKTKGLIGASTATLFREGVIEYVDSFEVESRDTLVADTFEQVENRKKSLLDLITWTTELKERKRLLEENLARDPDNAEIREELETQVDKIEKSERNVKKLRDKRPFSHVEMDPSSIMGISANIIPYPNHNPGPRNTYQASMAKQALGIMRAHHMACFDGKHKVLAYPTRPLFEPQMNQLLNLNAYPQGEMVWVAFNTFTGDNQEDAVIWNRASIDLGKFRFFKFNNIRVTFKTNSGKVEKLQLPEGLSARQRTTTFRHINENGLPNIGAHIEQREVVVGKAVFEGKEQKADESVRLGYGEEGIVDRVFVTENGAETIVTVRLRLLRIPVEGDKFAPRNAQKGTIGRIVDPEELPYTEDGIIPDVIVNPHAMPSRMTMTYVMEMIASKAGAIRGERQNATAFREFDSDKFRSVLRDYGYQDNGKHVMYSGRTGKKLESQIFSGPVYFQALKHHVKDKIQARRDGPISATSRQPVKGRAKMGGLRFGEMERNAAIAHGAAYFAQERLCGVSDCYRAVYCKCGQVASSNTAGGYTCRQCGDDASFGYLETTAALRLLNMFLATFGFSQTLDFNVKEQHSRMIAGGYLEEGEGETVTEYQGYEEDYAEEDFGAYEY